MKLIFGQVLSTLKGFFGTQKGFLYVPNYNEKGFFENFILFVMDTTLLL